MEMEGVVANAPRNSTLLTRGGRLVGLTLDAKVHDVISADSTIIDDNIPSP